MEKYGFSGCSCKDPTQRLVSRFETLEADFLRLNNFEYKASIFDLLSLKGSSSNRKSLSIGIFPLLALAYDPIKHGSDVQIRSLDGISGGVS